MELDPNSLEDLREYRDFLQDLLKLATEDAADLILPLLAGVEVRIARLEREQDN